MTSDALPTVVLLAGGLGTRMRPLTETVPKAMLEVAGEPFIAHQLRLLAARGIRDVVVCTGFLGEQIADFVGSGERFGLSVAFVPDGPALRGTGGAIQNAIPHLGPEFFVTYGDAYLDDDYQAIYAAYRTSGLEALLVVYKNMGEGDVSNASFDGSRVRYDKRNPTADMPYIDWGLSLLRAETFRAYPEDGGLDLAEILADLSRRGQLAGYETRNRFHEIGSLQGLDESTAFLRVRG
jgi:NDP-sugar pyrophosphorylase family protein